MCLAWEPDYLDKVLKAGGFKWDNPVTYAGINNSAALLNPSIRTAGLRWRELLFFLDSNDPNFDKELQGKKAILQARYREIKKHAHDPQYTKLWDVYPCQSGYFLCLRLKGLDAETLRKQLLMTYGVGVISSGARDIRIAFSCLEREKIEEMLSLTAQAVRDLMT